MPDRTVALMDTHKLAYLGGGVLVAIIVVTIIGIPPGVWITLGLGAAVIGIGLVIRQAQADGVDIAERVAGMSAPTSMVAPPPAEVAAHASDDVQVELVRPADEANDVTAVWLHRRGGRRVHRFATPEGWVVQRVSTKDPDNPKLRVIGETLTFATEGEAIAAANDLAHGLMPAAADGPLVATEA